MIQDRNFDDLAEHFQRRIYGGLKGDIRLAVLWRDLEQGVLSRPTPPLRVLDIGAGFSQIAIKLAKSGHQVVVNDISGIMLEMARESAHAEGVEKKITWYHAPFQELEKFEHGSFDLVLSHAVLEWLARPQSLIQTVRRFLAPQGVFSLTFYNYHSLIYRNLIRGNFHMLKKAEFIADPGSLTPGTPLLPKQVQAWLAEARLEILDTSGIRVFHDYVTTQRGGNAVPEDVIEMELQYSRLEPYVWLGRYIHHLCRPVD